MAANEICAPVVLPAGKGRDQQTEYWMQITMLTLLGVVVLLAVMANRDFFMENPPRRPGWVN
jgi:hypothetical protein